MRIAAIFAISCLIVSGAAYAQINTKPGLWEISSKMSMPSNPQLTKQMEESQRAFAAMPPAQRKQMEEMIAKQGVNLSGGVGGATMMKMCITPEMANRAPIEQRQGCTYKFSQSGNTHSFTFQCKEPQGEGEGKYTFSDADNYSGVMRTSSMQGGKKETMEMQTTGKFLGVNCGAIKPLPALAK